MSFDVIPRPSLIDQAYQFSAFLSVATPPIDSAFSSPSKDLSFDLQSSQPLDEEASRPTTPVDQIQYQATDGPTPGRNVSLKVIPSTIERVKRRDGIIKRSLSKRLSQDFQKKIDFIKNNELLRNALKNQELQKRINKLGKVDRKKCFTFCEVAVFTNIGETLSLVGSKKIDALFWSSYETKSKVDINLIGVQKHKIRSSVGNKKAFAMHDHHSERACIMWLAENIAGVAKGVFEKNDTPIDEQSVIHVNMISKFSSCRNCSVVFGAEGNIGRIPDNLQGEIIKALSLSKEKFPHVTLIHQGLKHHHTSSKYDAEETPAAELYLSTSFTDKE